MPSAQTVRRLYDELLSRYGVKIAELFQAAVAKQKSAADISRLTAAIQAGDLDEAVHALHLHKAAYNDFLDGLASAYLEGGQHTASTLPKLRGPDGFVVPVVWDVRNPRAEAWLREHAAEWVTREIEEQKALTRERIAAGVSRGENPTRTALALVGRVSRVTGKREGGVIGLSRPQEAYVAAARAELASKDPAALRHYLTRGRRDRRFDRTIAKAIRGGTAPPKEIAAKAGVAYERRLLQLRGETIARTEALTALNAAQDEALRQQVDNGTVTADQVRKVWRSAADKRVRDTHQGLNGESVGLDGFFMSESGAMLRYPGDPTAPSAERINCRCVLEPRIDYLANYR